jgi:hypothetical protein
MPIRINLLAEAQAAEEMRRKDPVKRAIWAGAVVVSLVLLFSLSLQFKIMAAKSTVTSLQSNWQSIEKDVQTVNEARNNTRDIERKLAAIDQFTTNRMLWGSALNAFQHTVVDGVQIVQIRTEQTFVVNEVKTNTKTNTAAPSVTERINVTIEGRDYLSGDQLPKLRQTLTNYPYFSSALQKTNNIQLTSLSAPQTDGARTYRAFGLQLFFQEKERRLHE